MNTTEIPELSAKAHRIADRAGYELSSTPGTGALLRTLAAAKPGGRILEVGAGVGVGAGWLLDGMDEASRLVTIEKHPKIANVCRTILAGDPRAEVVTGDAVEWLDAYEGPDFDLVFVDTTVAKFERRDAVFAHMAPGSLFIADDLLPQPKWTEQHAPRVERFRREILEEPCLVPTLIDWSSGIVVAAYRKGLSGRVPAS